MRAQAALRARAADLIICVLLFAAGVTAGTNYNRVFIAGGGQPQYYQRELDAAVMDACGRGFTRVTNLAEAPALEAFLRQKRQRLDCSEIPAGVATETPDIVARVSKYLFAGIATLWWLRGISWEALDPLFGVLFGASAVAAYALFRIAMNSWVAAACTIACLASAAQFNNLPHLRDYAKAPFAIAIIAFAGWIASRSHDRRTLVLLSAVAGAVLGGGVGFRTDLMLFAVAAPVAILLAPPDKRQGADAKALAIGVFALTFVVTAWPILRTYAGGNNIWHVIVLGMMSAFDDPLGVTTPFYSLGRLYHDEYVSMSINSYAARVLGSPEAFRLASKAYEQASLSYFKEVLATMPADLLIRFYVSILHILRLPFDSSGGPPQFIVDDSIRHFYSARARVLAPVGPLIPFLAAGALAVISSASVRLAVFWVFAIALFAGMPALQYHERHFFHLEVLGWLLLGAAVTQILRWIGAGRARNFRFQRPARKDVLRPIVFLTVFAIVTFGTLAGLRAYQRSAINALVRAILSAPATPVRVDMSDDGWPIVRPGDLSADADALAASAHPRIRTTYLSVLVTPTCHYETIPVGIKYGPPRESLSTTITAALPDDAAAATRMILPVYEQLGALARQPATTFEQIEIRAPQECFGGVWRIDPPREIALLPFLTLDETWPAADHFQSMRGNDAGERLYVDPSWAPVPRSLRRAELEPALTAPSYVQPPAVRSQGRWIVRGHVDRQYGYIVMADEEKRARGTRLVARGSLEQGGFTLGLLHQRRWSSRVDITTPGRFRIVLDVPEDGAYQVVLANNAPNSLRNAFVIDEIGWAAGPVR